MKKKFGGVFALAIFLVCSGVTESHEAKHSQAHGTSGGNAEASFNVSKGERLEVSIDSGDITIVSWAKNEVSVKAQGIEEEDNLNMVKEGNTVRIEYSSEWGNGRVRFNVQMPGDFNTDLHTSGGDISFQGSFNGDLQGSTSGGNIIMGDVGGTIRMETSGGDIRVNLVNGDGFFETSGGDIEVQKVLSKVELHTSGGDITVGNVGKSLIARTAGGSIKIGDVGGEADLNTAGGDVIVGRVSGRATLKTEGGDIQLSGATGGVRAKTAGGDLSLLNVSGSILGETAGGDIVAELIPSGTGVSRLATNGGDVTLSLPENSKATIHARIRIRGRWNDMRDEYSIVSDFQSSSYEKDDEKREIRGTYTLNGGGEDITLDTVNGDIYIRKLKR
jgi:DUF4097 and DUF4098 domain-containing protein YvlB